MNKWAGIVTSKLNIYEASGLFMYLRFHASNSHENHELVYFIQITQVLLF